MALARRSIPSLRRENREFVPERKVQSNPLHFRIFWYKGGAWGRVASFLLRRNPPSSGQDTDLTVSQVGERSRLRTRPPGLTWCTSRAGAPGLQNTGPSKWQCVIHGDQRAIDWPENFSPIELETNSREGIIHGDHPVDLYGLNAPGQQKSACGSR